MKYLNTLTDPNNKNVNVTGHTHVWSDLTDIATYVSTIPVANKLLYMNASGLLPTSITGDAATVGGKTVAQINPPGEIVFYANSTPPAGCLKANGALVSRTTYAALFIAIGTLYGVGDGSTTFALPDLRGEFIRGFDDARGVDTGRAIGSAQVQDTQPHVHNTYYITAASSTYNYPRNSYMGSSTVTVTPAGATASYGTKETRPRNIALLCCIRY